MSKHEEYQPVILNDLGQKIYEFCQQNSQITFNAPPDYQPAFVQATENFPAGSKYLHRMFFDNLPVIEFLKKIRDGDMCLMFIPEKKIGGLTLISEVRGICKIDDIPPNWRLDIHPTKSFRRYFGNEALWTSHIAAITLIKKLTRTMCWQDPEANIFIEKATGFGINN